MDLELACLDMAGTTIRDDGVVSDAFREAIASAGLRPNTTDWETAQRVVTATMGQSKISVFRQLFHDEALAQTANRAFECSYRARVDAGLVEAMPGAVEVMAQLRDCGAQVCLTTGFASTTRDVILDRLGWHGLIDLALSPADAGRGRPAPDMILLAALRLQVSRMAAVAVVGDTASDIESGRRAGAGLVVGVTSGSGAPHALEAAGADIVLADITGLPDLLGLPAQPTAALPDRR